MTAQQKKDDDHTAAKAAAVKKGKEAPEATVIEPVAAMPMSTYPEYKDGEVVVPEEHDDDDKS